MATSRRPMVTLAAAVTISLIGTRLSMIALPWLVLTTTGDPVRTGIVGLAEMLPYALAQAFGGPWIDRLGARRITVAADIVSMLTVSLVPLLHLAGLLGFETLLPIVALLGALRGPADAAKHAMIPAVAASAGAPLSRVTGIIGTIERLAGAVGAAAGGALVAVVGPVNALLVTAATCFLSALVIGSGLRTLTPVASDMPPAAASYFSDLRDGWRYFRGDAVLVGIVIMVAITNLLDQAYVVVLLPVWANIAGDVTLLGLLLASFSAGSVAGSVLATIFGERLPRLIVYTVAFLITGGPRFLIFATGSPIAIIVAVLATAGFASGFLNPILGAVIFERIPPHLTGRVSALVNALCWTLMPFGGLFGGLLVAGIGLAPAFALVGVLYLGATMLPLATRGFRSFAERPATP